jgi:hypothetical protein
MGPVASYYFTLEVDGVLQASDYQSRSIVSTRPTILRQLWVYNFPAGMTGTHTFTGHWYGHCQTSVDNGSYPGPCPSPNASIEVLTSSLTINFP